MDGCGPGGENLFEEDHAGRDLKYMPIVIDYTVLIPLGTLETSHQISKKKKKKRPRLRYCSINPELKEGEKCMDRYPTKQSKRQNAVSDSRSC